MVELGKVVRLLNELLAVLVNLLVAARGRYGNIVVGLVAQTGVLHEELLDGNGYFHLHLTEVTCYFLFCCGLIGNAETALP